MLRFGLSFQVTAFAGAVLLGAAGVPTAWAGSVDHGRAMTMPSDGAMSMGGPTVGSQPAFDASASRITGPQHITVYVLPGGNGLGFTGPDMAHHDTVVPSSFVLRKGVAVTFTVINFDDMHHSITAPGIDRRNGAITPSTTTYTFTPTKAGQFRWFCVFPCDMPTHWAMSASYDGPDRDGFMAGIIRVL